MEAESQPRSAIRSVINPSGRDVQRFLETMASAPSLETERIESDHYLNEVIAKPWGHEYRAYADSIYDVWKLSIAEGQSTSVHCHPRKETMLLCLAGRGRVHLLNHTRPLAALDYVHLRKGIFHGTENVGNTPLELIEVETPRNKLDLVRIQDKYGRKGKGYERATVPKDIRALEPAPYGSSACIRRECGRFRFDLRAGLDLVTRRDPHLLFAVSLGLRTLFDQDIHVVAADRLEARAVHREDMYLTVSQTQ
jgi:mannose-6-phosphate isomerase-like protein (cupin superfamily)